MKKSLRESDKTLDTDRPSHGRTLRKKEDSFLLLVDNRYHAFVQNREG
jgi:hypothetical protein